MPDEDILQLSKVCSLMSNASVRISFLRTGDGDKINISGSEGITKASLKTFVAKVCPNAKVFFVSGTQFNHNDTYEFIANRQLENVIVPDVKRTNSKMSIYPDKWQVNSINFWERDAKGNQVTVLRIANRIKEIYDENAGHPLLVFLMARKYANAVTYQLKQMCPELLEHAHGKEPQIRISYYRSVFSTGVKSDARVCVVIGCAELPKNVNDMVTRNYIDSQCLRVQSVDAATWQAWSRVKDPNGEVASKIYCIGIKKEKVLRVITWGSNRTVTFGDNGKINVSVDEELPRPNIAIVKEKRWQCNEFSVK
jgi:hypothetical protein